jgi:hypothetical protein
VNFYKQEGDNTCWAACIRVLQELAHDMTAWHEPCVADRSVTQVCGQPHVLDKGHDQMLSGDDFLEEARRCLVTLIEGPTSRAVDDFTDALQAGVVAILRCNHYQVVLRDCGDHWCVYDPSKREPVEQSPAWTVRTLWGAWTLECDKLIRECCTG